MSCPKKRTRANMQSLPIDDSDKKNSESTTFNIAYEGMNVKVWSRLPLCAG